MIRRPDARPMSLQRRLLSIVMIGTPLVWLIAAGISLWGASHEIDELFDTQQVRLARQVYAILPHADPSVSSAVPAAAPAAATPPPLPSGTAAGQTELEDMAVAAWDRDGRSLLQDADAMPLPYRAGADGFVELADPRDPRDRWRVFYLNAPQANAVVAVGQRLHEREELIRDLLIGQLAPWLAMLALLLLVLVAGIRRALAPVVTLARDIEDRPSSDLRPLPAGDTPAELAPLVAAINRLFGRIAASIEHDRRFTADAAHELRTPLAATRAQWDVANAAEDPARRAVAAGQVTRGLERMSGLVSQLLAQARLDAVESASFDDRIDWSDVISQALPDVLPLADRRGIEIGVDWRVPPESVLPLVGSADLITAAVRNLVDNAVRYAPPGSRVTIACDVDAIAVIDEGPGVPEAVLPRLGDRFFRAGGQDTTGSGLGLSIVGRTAGLHALALHLANRDGGGFIATLRRAPRA